MTPLERWTKQIQDAIAENSALREGLQDDEVMPLIDWGAHQAEQLGARMSAPSASEPDEEQVANTAYSLVRLMTRITWLAVYRHKKDATWLTRTFQTINQLNRELNGPDAPVFSDDDIANWIASHAQYSNADLVNSLIAHLSLTQAGGEAGTPAASPAQPAKLPGREAGSSDEPPARPASLPGREAGSSDEPPARPTSLPGRDAGPPAEPPARPTSLPGRDAEPPFNPASHPGENS
jgi:hypothetical protein